MVLKIIDSKCS